MAGMRLEDYERDTRCDALLQVEGRTNRVLVGITVEMAQKTIAEAYVRGEIEAAWIAIGGEKYSVSRPA